VGKRNLEVMGVDSEFERLAAEMLKSSCGLTRAKTQNKTMKDER
jgi:hypothetical protein